MEKIKVKLFNRFSRKVHGAMYKANSTVIGLEFDCFYQGNHLTLASLTESRSS